MTAGRLDQLAQRTRVILLDFDGPVCSLFANHPASAVASELRQILATNGIPIPDAIASATDPVEILRMSDTVGRPDLVRRVEDALRAAELAAARTAAPTPYAREVIVTAHQTGRKVAVVSNNSAEAITTYLDANRLASYVYPVVGRVYADPSQLKPNPGRISLAVAELHAKPAECLLVGDSVGDVAAARDAQVAIVGYANKPGKAARLADADADAIITSMAELATALSEGEL
jgi:HAD superfamily hydrolase (TIGR01549 family)